MHQLLITCALPNELSVI